MKGVDLVLGDFFSFWLKEVYYPTERLFFFYSSFLLVELVDFS